jgi:hypothetical protein
MNGRGARVRELAGWGLDQDEYRPDFFDHRKPVDAHAFVGQRPLFQTESAVVDVEDSELCNRFAELRLRLDLLEEMTGLEWSLGVVDLRLLLAFQRRLVLNPAAPHTPSPAADDWAALVDLSFGPPKPVVCDLIRSETTILLQSGNPNLHFRTSADPASPVIVHGGSPFFEVAQYRGRWFLRDGYHRAYALLRAGIFQLPAVIVQARSLVEMGAVRPWFFSEEVLFSSSPPRVTDFLDDAFVLEYDRTPLLKTLRLTMEEIFSPAASSGENL